jgi:cytochrome c oxidase subunit 3
VVSKSRPDWLKDFVLPSAFYVSTALILLGSLTMHMAKKYIQKDQRAATTKMLWATLMLGILFFVFQFIGFQQIISQGYYFTGSASSITTTFLYVVTLTHLLHLLGGIISLVVIIYNHFKQKYNASQTLGIELGAMYWHFLDLLWIYLFLFLNFFN